jgi:hypothetical protein
MDMDYFQSRKIIWVGPEAWIADLIIPLDDTLSRTIPAYIENERMHDKIVEYGMGGRRGREEGDGGGRRKERGWRR